VVGAQRDQRRNRAPPLSGSIFVSATPTQTSIDGQAANWGDLFSLSNTPGSSTWLTTDVSATGGSSARTVGDAVTGIQVGTTLTLYAAGVDSPPPQGVGVYAIPSSKWSQAITDGCPSSVKPVDSAHRVRPGWLHVRHYRRQLPRFPHGSEHLQLA